MTLYFQECAESPPSVDPVHTAMSTIDATAIFSNDKLADKYLPEPQSFKAVLNLKIMSPQCLFTCHQNGSQELNQPQYFHTWQNIPQRQTNHPGQTCLKNKTNCIWKA
jgi:hypothetical protein